MGFRTNSFATVWSVERVSDTFTKGRISISRKNKDTGNYEQDFSGFVSFIGTACAQRALGLKERDRIKLTSIDVTTQFNKEKHVTYTNFNIYAFETADGGSGNSSNAKPASPSAEQGDGELSDGLPF